MKEPGEEIKEVEGVRTRNSSRKVKESRRMSKRETNRKIKDKIESTITDTYEEKEILEVSEKGAVDTQEEMNKQTKGKNSDIENGVTQQSTRSRRRSNREQVKMTQLKKKENEEESEKYEDLNKSEKDWKEENETNSKEVGALSPKVENVVSDKIVTEELENKRKLNNEESMEKKYLLEKWNNRNKISHPPKKEMEPKKEKEDSKEKEVEPIERKDEKKDHRVERKEREKEKTKEGKETNSKEEPDHKNHKRSISTEKQKIRNKEKERDRDRMKYRDRSRERSRDKKRRKYNTGSDNDEDLHSHRRRRKDSYKGGKDRSNEESVERSRNRKRYEEYSSSDKEDRSYHRSSKKKRRKRKGNHSSSSERNFSSSSRSSSRSYKNKNQKERSVSSSKSAEKKKKTKWDTVDENLLKNTLIDVNLQNILQKQNLTFAANSLLQNNKILQLNRNSYEMETDKKQRKLYIGNIPANCKQEDIIDFFNKVLLTLIKDTSMDMKVGEVQLMPVVKCDIFNIDSRFCFLEFRTAEITSLSLRMDGVSFNNYTLRIGRPHDYIPPPGGDPAFTSEFIGVDFKIIETLKQNRSAQTKNGDDEHKLYIQNLPHDLKDEQIRDILEQFGKLKAFNIIKEPTTGLNKGYGFFEYEDTNCTQVAIHALNGFVCGHNILNVKKAASNKNQNAQNSASGNPEGYVSLMRNSISQKILSNSIIGLQVQASRKVGEKPSKVVQLTNIIFQEDLLIDSQYEEILKEIKEEAEKYGPLQSVVIPKPNLDLPYTEGVGKVFLHYFDETTARKAQYMLNGRLFEKRVICAAFYSEELFLKGKYVLP